MQYLQDNTFSHISQLISHLSGGGLPIAWLNEGAALIITIAIH